MSRNVLFVESPKTRYGSGMSMLNLIDGLDASRYAPHVVVHALNPIQEDLAARNIPTRGIEIPDISLRPNRRRPTVQAPPHKPREFTSENLVSSTKDALRYSRDHLQYFMLRRAIQRAIREWDIDIVHLNDQPSTNRFAYLCDLSSVRVVQHIRCAPLAHSSYLRGLVWRKCQKLICISDFVASHAVSAFGDTIETATIPNPIELPSEHEKGERSGFDSTSVTFMQVGRIIPLKGVDICIKAFQEAFNSEGDMHTFEIAGSSVTGHELYFEDVEQLAKNDRRVLLSGYHQDMSHRYKECNVLIHYTSEPEGFGRVVAEAMSFGCVPIVRNLGGPPEIVEHMSSGIVVDSIEELSQWMRRLAKDPGLYEALSRGAIARSQTFEKDKVANQVMSIYDNLLEFPGRPIRPTDTF